MAKPPTDRQRRSLETPLQFGGKLSTAQIMRLSYAFAAAVPIKRAAASQDVSQKTARQFYFLCRDHLKAPAFRRWHSLSLINPNLPNDVFSQATPKVAFFDVMAECHGNETCYRNFRLGNRKSRFCRACPLEGKFTGPLAKTDAIHVIDAVHEVYQHLGLRREVGADPVANFRDRLLHTIVIKELQDKSVKRADGTLDPADMSYEGAGTFVLLLMDALAEPPLEAKAQPNLDKTDITGSENSEAEKSDQKPELVDWLLDDGTVIWLPVGEKPPRS